MPERRKTSLIIENTRAETDNPKSKKKYFLKKADNEKTKVDIKSSEKMVLQYRGIDETDLGEEAEEEEFESERHIDMDIPDPNQDEQDSNSLIFKLV